MAEGSAQLFLSTLCQYHHHFQVRFEVDSSSLAALPNYLSRLFSLSARAGGHLTHPREKGHKALSNRNGYDQYCKIQHHVN